MIKEFIESKKITDVKESQFRYELGKIKKRMLAENIELTNLLTIGRIQKNMKTNDRVYLFNVEVLKMLYRMLKAKGRRKKKS
ncbi:hypothetical protein T1E_2897 [Pseudomonas putida DOT-T1E]|uniref:Uncharacterized protein n=2 Tax=Pseudomonas putida TaxID=303 RepID=I7C6I3_PSEPT|nr:hypothetical protein T1E_2897 [Pseudomonas putida DOT-T1E]